MNLLCPRSTISRWLFPLLGVVAGCSAAPEHANGEGPLGTTAEAVLAQVLAAGPVEGVARSGNTVLFSSNSHWVTQPCTGTHLERVSGTGSQPLYFSCTRHMGLQADASAAYFAENPYLSTTPKPATLTRFDLVTNTRRVLASSSSPIYGLTLDDAWVYWSNAEGLWRVPKQGGAASQLSTAAVAGLVVDATYVYGGSQHGVFRFQKATGASVALSTESATHLALGGSDVYFTSFFSGRVARVPRVGGHTSVLYLPFEAVTSGPLVVDAANVFWVEAEASSGAARVRKLRLAGGTAETLFEGFTHGGALVDGTRPIVGGGSVTAGQLYLGDADALRVMPKQEPIVAQP